MYKFYFSKKHKEHLTECAKWGPSDMYPQGYYTPLIAILESGEIVEYTRACNEDQDDEIEAKRTFSDYIYLGRGEMAGYGRYYKGRMIPLWDSVGENGISSPVVKEPGFGATCDRCKLWRTDCQDVPYKLPDETLDLLANEEIALADIESPSATMCAECRALKAKFSEGSSTS